MQRTRWIYFVLFVALFTLIAVPIYLFNRSLGPSLQLDMPAQGGYSESQENPPAALFAKLPQEDDSNRIDCGGSGRVNILYLGQNLPETPQRGADAIRLMFINYEAPSIASLSIPPDTLVEVADIEQADQTTLTKAFWLGQQSLPTGQPAALRSATEVVAQALYDNFGYTTEKYLIMNQPVFGRMIDTLGGIWVDVGSPVASSGEMGPFEPGLQEMDSQRVLDYVRILASEPQVDAELSRFERQNEVVRGIYEGLLDPGNILKLPSLIGDFYHLLVTDLKPKELRSLHCMLTEQEVHMRFEQVNGEMITGIIPERALEPDIAAVTALVAELESWDPVGSD